MKRYDSSPPAAGKNARGRLRAAFTLIELLVVVAIIALLVTILMPSLKQAKEMARRVICATNLHGCGRTLMLYATENRGVLPAAIGENPDGSDFYTQPLSSNRFVVRGWGDRMDYDLRERLLPYLGNAFRMWMCPSLDVPPIDDPGNTRGICYGPYLYFGGDVDHGAAGSPDFGLGTQIPQRLDGAPPSLPLMQDRASDRRNWNGAWAGNHVVSGWYDPPLDENPSNPRLYVDSADDILGANITLYDGSVSWHDMGSLVDVGDDEWHANNFVYSVLP